MKYDPRDLSKVYLRDDDGQYWSIPYRDLRLPPISLWEHQAATKRLKAEGRRGVDEKVLFEIVEEQRRLAEERRRQSTGSLATGSSIEQNPSAPDPVDRDLIRPFEVEEWE